MKNFMYKLFLWFKDRFSLLFQVVFRLDIGKKKKEQTNNIGESDEEDES